MSDNGEEFSASGDEFAMPELVSSDPKEEEEVKTEASRSAHDLSVPFAAIDRLAKLIGEGDKMDADSRAERDMGMDTLSRQEVSYQRNATKLLVRNDAPPREEPKYYTTDVLDYMGGPIGVRNGRAIGEGDELNAILHEESVAAVKRADETSKMAQQPHRFESDGFEAVKKTASETSYAQSRGVELADAIIRQADEAMKRSSETRNEAKTAPRLSERQAATNALYDEVIRLQKVENTLKAALQSAPQKAAATAFIEHEYAELKDFVFAGKLSLDQFKVLWEAALLVERRMDPPK